MITGSTAAKYWIPEWREPADLDTISPGIPEYTSDNYWDDAFLEYREEAWWAKDYYASIDELYTIKVSHAYWELKNGSWGKHIYDMLKLQEAGAHLLPDLHRVLYKAWENLHGSKKMQFMDKNAFFEDAVTRIYDHDSIHDSVAYGEEAMYVQTLKRAGHTAVDMDYIKGMPFPDQVKLFREEVCATALERIMVPRSYRGSAGAAYLWALRRTITSLTKGWSAQFIVENYSAFMKPDDYVKRHLANKNKLILLEEKAS